MSRPPARSISWLVLAALLVTACGDDDTDTAADGTIAEQTTSTTAAPPTDEPTSTTTVPGGADQLIEVSVAGGAVENGGRHAVAVGGTVAIVVTSDVADEIHVHGYDVYADIGPGGPVTAMVEATIPGVWEVELHDSGLVLLELAVS